MNRFIAMCLIALFCGYTPNVVAQKCKLEKDEIDGFSKERYKLTQLQRLCEEPYWWIQMEQKGKNYFFNFSISAFKDVRQSIAKGTKLMAKLEDGSIFEFVSEKDAPPTANVEQPGGFSQPLITTQWNVTVSVTEEQLIHFSKSPITLMRTTIGETETNMPEAVGKYTSRVMNMALCMLKKD